MTSIYPFDRGQSSRFFAAAQNDTNPRILVPNQLVCKIFSVTGGLLETATGSSQAAFLTDFLLVTAGPISY